MFSEVMFKISAENFVKRVGPFPQQITQELLWGKNFNLFTLLIILLREAVSWCIVSWAGGLASLVPKHYRLPFILLHRSRELWGICEFVAHRPFPFMPRFSDMFTAKVQPWVKAEMINFRWIMYCQKTNFTLLASSTKLNKQRSRLDNSLAAWRGANWTRGRLLTYFPSYDAKIYFWWPEWQ